jgi:hypothetical protein
VKLTDGKCGGVQIVLPHGNTDLHCPVLSKCEVRLIGGKGGEVRIVLPHGNTDLDCPVLGKCEVRLIGWKGGGEGSRFSYLMATLTLIVLSSVSVR